jgi:ParB-like chromosome segregation protein Spo0J
MSETKKVSIDKLKPNPDNPRIIKDDKFKKLVQSIKDFPEMLKLRPIVVDKDMVVLGGNMRLRALKDAGVKEVEVIIADSLTDDQKREFIIKDNVGFGEWNWETLANEWDSDKLDEWGLTVNNFNTDSINLDDFFEESNEQKEQKNKIVLEYTDEEFELVNEEFKKHSGSKEQIVYKLLGL